MRTSAALLALVSVTSVGRALAAPSRVACIGDSITQGVGASSPSKDWVSDLRCAARFRRDGRQLRRQRHDDDDAKQLVLLEHGRARDGRELRHGGRRKRERRGHIMLGTNDSKDNPSGVNNWTATAPTRYAADYNSMIDALLALAPKLQVFLALPPPAFANTFSIDGTVIANQIIPIVVGIASKRQLPVIDVHTALAGMSSLFPDGVHPNDMGHMLIARAMQQGLLSPAIPPPPPDAGALDAAGATDAAGPADATAARDATAPSDAATPEDAASASDAEAHHDASIAQDASTSSDGSATPDAGMPTEGGEGAAAAGGNGGCGCTTAGRRDAKGLVSWIVAALLGALGLRRRRPA